MHKDKSCTYYEGSKKSKCLCATPHLVYGDIMAIKSETIAKLLFESACLNKLFRNIRIVKDYKKLNHNILQLFASELERLEEDIKSPIEKIMYGILMNCENGYEDVAVLADEEYPFNFCSSVHYQKEIGNYTCDFMIDTFTCERIEPHTRYTISKIIIECDGHDFHEKTKEQAKKDKQRDRFLVSEGYKVLRFTGSEIYNNFEDIIKEITNILNKDIDVWMENNSEIFNKLVMMSKKYEKKND